MKRKVDKRSQNYLSGESTFIGFEFKYQMANIMVIDWITSYNDWYDRYKNQCEPI